MADSRPIDYTSLLHAYSLGCLDKEELNSLLKFFDTAKEYPWQELGEFQNLAALLPSFLNIEEPPAQLKDRVARTLYRLRDTKPPVKAPSVVIPPLPDQSFKTKTSLKEKMRSSAVVPPAPKAPAPQESEEIIAPPDFNSFSPFSQRAGVGARPQQDTQIRSRAQQDTPDRQALSGEQERKELNFDQDELDARFRESAPEEFIINQNYAEPEPEAQDDGLHLNFTEESSIEAEASATFHEPETTSEDQQQQFEFNITDDKPAPPQSSSAKLEEIRQRVVADVEKESSQAPPVEEEKAKAAPPLILYIMPILIILGVAVVYYLLNTKIKNLQGGSATSGQYVSKEDFDKLKENAAPRWSSEVLSILLKKDSRTVLLTGSGNYASSYGKVILDSKTGEGFLALGFLPIPPPETRYHFWLLEGKNATHLEFKEVPAFSQESVTYTPIGKLPLLKGKKEVFLLTIEKSGSAPTQPSQQRCLEGIVQ